MSKTYHKADKIAPDGRVSALCFKRPRAIDLKRATWTINDDAVTCGKCIAKIVASETLPA